MQAAKLAVARLSGAVGDAADSWVDSVSIAARKGDHRPAKDLLLHTRVIEPVGDENGPRVVVQIGVQDSDVKVNILDATRTLHVTAGADETSK